MIKRILSIILTILLLLSMCACNQTQTQPANTNNTEIEETDEIAQGTSATIEPTIEETLPTLSPDNNAHVDEDEKMEYTIVGECKVYVVDDAKLLTDEEEKALCTELFELCENINYNILFFTYDDAHGATTQNYTDTYMDMLFKSSNDNIGFIIDMDNREIYINTMGTAITRLNNVEIEQALDVGFEHISNDEYAECLLSMAKSCLERMQ